MLLEVKSLLIQFYLARFYPELKMRNIYIFDLGLNYYRLKLLEIFTIRTGTF